MSRGSSSTEYESLAQQICGMRFQINFHREESPNATRENHGHSGKQSWQSSPTLSGININWTIRINRCQSELFGRHSLQRARHTSTLLWSYHKKVFILCPQMHNWFLDMIFLHYLQKQQEPAAVQSIIDTFIKSSAQAVWNSSCRTWQSVKPLFGSSRRTVVSFAAPLKEWQGLLTQSLSPDSSANLSRTLTFFQKYPSFENSISQVSKKTPISCNLRLGLDDTATFNSNPFFFGKAKKSFTQRAPC